MFEIKMFFSQFIRHIKINRFVPFSSESAFVPWTLNKFLDACAESMTRYIVWNVSRIVMCDQSKVYCFSVLDGNATSKDMRFVVHGLAY